MICCFYICKLRKFNVPENCVPVIFSPISLLWDIILPWLLILNYVFVIPWHNIYWYFLWTLKCLSQSHNYKATYTENVYFQHAVWAIIFKRPWIKILMLDTWKQKCITIKVIRCLYGHLWDWTLCWRISFFLAPLQETCLLIIFVTVYRFIYE
jgi:hypothetical protein